MAFALLFRLIQVQLARTLRLSLACMLVVRDIDFVRHVTRHLVAGLRRRTAAQWVPNVLLEFLVQLLFLRVRHRILLEELTKGAGRVPGSAVYRLLTADLPPTTILSTLSSPIQELAVKALKAVKTFVAVALSMALAGCGGGGDSPSGPVQPTATVASVSVSGTATVDVGKTVVLSAQARDAAGAAISGKAFTWSSASDAVATVASDGTVTGKSAGTTSVSASVDGKTGSLSVTVTPAAWSWDR